MSILRWGAQMRMRAKRVGLALVTMFCLTGTVGAVGVASSSPSEASGSPITIGLICSCTGPAGPEYRGTQGALMARIDRQNAKGGVNGHKIQVIFADDATSPAQDPTAVQNVISKGVIGIVAVSAVFFSGAKFANQAHLPVTGASSDGPEWGTQPYTNMFASDTGSIDPKYPVNTQIGKFLTTHGGSVVGSYGYGISPSSSRSAIATVRSVVHAGGKQGVLDISVPFGSVAFGPEALAAKAAHITGLYAGMVDSSNFAMATSMKQAGVNLKAVVFPTGYEPSAPSSPAWPEMQGDYFDTEFRPFSAPNAATKAMQVALEKYDHFSKTRFPTLNEYEAWVGADLMIQGLQAAGKNPTPAAVIKDLRRVKSYNGNGLLPVPLNYSTNFGHDTSPACGWFLRAGKTGFSLVSNKPFCGTDIPGTSTATASS
jgi:ABC-type branched-subunit amino acid transport system substrate-binding protein